MNLHLLFAIVAILCFLLAAVGADQGAAGRVLMSHTITLGGLLLTLGAIGGFVAAALGLFMIFAGMMSDAEGDGPGWQGCLTFVIGVTLLAGCILALVL